MQLLTTCAEYILTREFVSLYVFLPVVYKWLVIVNIDEFVISCIDFVVLANDRFDLIVCCVSC